MADGGMVCQKDGAEGIAAGEQAGRSSGDLRPADLVDDPIDYVRHCRYCVRSQSDTA